MPVEIDKKQITRVVLIIKAKQKLTEKDYDKFVPEIEELIKKGKIRILLDLEDFDGWTASAAWKDTTFGVKHFNDIERLAIVGDEILEKGMAVFCKAFTTADIKFFNRNQMDEAKKWIGLER